MRLTPMVADFVIGATRCADGRLNRAALLLLDPPVPAIPVAVPWRGGGGVATRDIAIDPAMNLRGRLFLPSPAAAAGAAPLPVIVFFHGGGFVFFSAASLAFDDDGLAALRFLDDPKNHNHRSAAPFDVSRCFLAGDSAGANIAHHVARRYATNPSFLSNIRLVGVIAIQPFFGGEERTPAEIRLDGAAPIVSMARTDWMWRAFLTPGADRTHEADDAASPATAPGLDSPAFPPVMVAIGGYDPLQDWQRRYGEMLRDRGKDVRVVEYPDAVHIWVLNHTLCARDLMVRIAEFVAESDAGHSCR
ncbi:unnamed protein product [Urochloa decumbens]|uniref:Alpha/beta hydrolase fold-3 domain-containing protein n=1 Tax=Urochloa decumbens TaxID=240449 RepID=A0ABC9B0J7_9POAL